MERENDIVKDAYYLVNVYKQHNVPITQIHIQKLMFLFEAYYMNMEDTNFLYDCDFQAWNFGPVAIPLYKQFKKYGKNNIILNQEQIAEGNSICEEKKKLIEELFDAFKAFSAMELVNFTHADGSPWKEAWEEKEYSIISKEKMKSWFSKYVKK